MIEEFSTDFIYKPDKEQIIVDLSSLQPQLVEEAAINGKLI
jgi:hypothetical protein